MATLGPNLTRFRAMAVRAMPDTCRVTRSTESGTLDPITGVWTPAPGSLVYEGICRVRPASQVDQEVMFGGEAGTEQRYVVTLPYDAPTVRRDDRVTIAASGDSQLTERHLAVLSVRVRSNHVDRRLGCEEIAE